MVLRPSAHGWLAIGFLWVIACHPAGAQQVPAQGASATRSDEQAAPGSVTAPEGKPALVPLGDLAGGYAVGSLPVDTPNPLGGQASAAEQGKQLFIQMNCAGCHGYAAAGGVMAPNLTGPYWRYGGTPVNVFKSIYEGRPKGMPAWGGILPPESIWMIVSFIQSLGGTFPASFYHQAWDGDRPGELAAPELAAGKIPTAQ
jgi:cytochrome c oxidase cbb3-type subunit III